MRLGIYMDLRNPPRWRRPWRDRYAQALERVSEADRLGLGSVWLSEHHMWEDGYLPQPLTFAAAIAQRTRRLRIGTSVLLAPLRRPLDIAEQAAIVDLVSGGRLELGMGAGYCAPEFAAYGAPLGQRFKLLEERIVEVRRLWEEGIATPAPLQERLPIWVGGQGPRAARIAGRHGEGLLWLGPESLEPYRQALAEGGHDPGSARLSGPANLVLADDPERAWAEISPHLAYQWGTYARYGSAVAGSAANAAVADLGATDRAGDPDPASLRSGGPIMTPPAFDVVTPEEAARRLRAWLDGLPVEHVYFWDSIAGMPDELAERHIELLATRLAPMLEEQWASS